MTSARTSTVGFSSRPGCDCRNLGDGRRRRAAGADAPSFTAAQATPAARRTRRAVPAAICATSRARSRRRNSSGSNFLNQWGDKTVADLHAYLMASMPPTNPGAPGAPDDDRHRRVPAAGERRALPDRRRSTPQAAVDVPLGAWRAPEPPVRGAAAASRRRQRGRRGGDAAPAAPRPQRADGRGRGEELRAGDRRDAAQSGSRRLADGRAATIRLELQPAERRSRATTSRTCGWRGCGR